MRGNDEPWLDESAYRKPYQDAKIYYENVFSKMIDGQYSADISAQKRELEKLKKQIQTEKIEYNKWLREEARDELILEKISNTIRDLPELDVPYPTYHQENKSPSRSAILAFGDAHFGNEFVITGLNGEIINEYNPEIFYSRMENLFCKTIDFIKQNDLSELYVYDLGDALDGILRVKQLMKLRFGVVEATIKYAEFLSNWLNELSYYCDIHFQTTHGNHTELRMLGQPKGTFDKDNMGEIILEFIKVRLEDNSKIHIKVNDTGLIFDQIQGFNIVGYHGESKNLERTLKDFSHIYKTPIDILIAAHLHHSYSETIGIGNDVIRIPSIIGVDDFSMSLHKTSNPGATIFMIEENKGKIFDYHIKL